MRKEALRDMTRGWFIGDFDPSLCATEACEVAVKEYKKGEVEEAHYHKIATEYTVVVSGQIRMFDEVFKQGDIVVVEPGEMTAFEALTDAVNVVVKIPGAKNDKYVVKGS